MERFGLTRLDLMTMTWTQVGMLFDATYDEEDSHVGSDVRYGTDYELKNWL